MLLVTYATFVTLFLLTRASATPTGVHRPAHDLPPPYSSHQSPNVYQRSANDTSRRLSGSRENKDNSALADVNGVPRAARVVTINAPTSAPAPSNPPSPPQLPSPPAEVAPDTGSVGKDLGPLIGAVIGTGIPAALLLGLFIWRRCLYIEPREGPSLFDLRRGVNSSSKSEEWHVGVRPEMHETVINERAAHCDGGRILTLEETQPFSVTRIECNREETSPSYASSHLHPVPRATPDTAVAHYVTYWAIRMPRAPTIALLEPVLVDLELGVSIAAEGSNSISPDARNVGGYARQDALCAL